MSKSARDKIRELRALQDDGLLSAEEFDRRKNAILDAQLAPTNPLRVATGAPRGHGTELGLSVGQEVGPADKRYRLERQLGQGGMGQVWLATDLATHAELGHSDKVALKILPPELTQSTLHARLLVEEATQARKLAHENIVRVYEWAQDPATTSYFIIMEYLEGIDLEVHLTERGTFALDQIHQMLHPVAQALRYAWDKHQLVHRDLKPSNLLLTHQGEMKLLDFGIAARVRSAANAIGMSSVLPANAGTAGYRAPEAGVRQRQPSPQLDVYALAVMIYQMLEGELPFGEVRNVQHVPSAPKVLDARQWKILQRGFAFQPEARPASSLALLDALFQVDAPPLLAAPRGGAPTPIPPVAPPTVAQPPKMPPTQEVQAQQQRQQALLEQQRQAQLEEKRKQAQIEAARQELEQKQRKQQAANRTQALREQVQRLRQEEKQRLAQLAEAQKQEKERKQREQALAQQKRQQEIEAQVRQAQAEVLPQAAGTEFRDPFLSLPFDPQRGSGPQQGPLMVCLRRGRFLMGSNERERQLALAAGAQPNWLRREVPQHWVSIDYPLAFAKQPLSVGEWRQFAEATGWIDEAEQNWRNPGFTQDDHHPVVWISWHDAQAYCRWLSHCTGRHYRLASEAEWEFACRAGSQSAFSFGEHIHCGLANYDGNFTWNGGEKGEARHGTTRIGSFAPNPWGLYDMHGNVWEWVQDLVHANYEGAPVDGSAWQSGDEHGHRVLRGGSWLYSPRYLRSGSRNGYGADSRNDIVGARIVRELEPDELPGL